MTEIKTVGVVGLGQMGAGIAQVAAVAGYQVVGREVDQQLAARALAGIEGRLAKEHAKGKLAEPVAEVMSRLRGVTTLAELSECDLVIEAIVENLQVKAALFAELGGLTSKHAILATNTSSLSVTEIGSHSGRLPRVVGMHFFNPVPKMALVELVRTVVTEPEVFAAAQTFVARLGKTAVNTGDSPGFIVNHLLVPFLLDAVRALERRLATREEIDAAMKLGCGHPMGPLELLDFVGLDTTVAIAEVFFAAFGEARYAAPPMLRQLVLAGRLGRKSGAGFYDYG